MRPVVVLLVIPQALVVHYVIRGQFMAKVNAKGRDKASARVGLRPRAEPVYVSGKTSSLGGRPAGRMVERRLAWTGQAQIREVHASGTG